MLLTATKCYKNVQTFDTEETGMTYVVVVKNPNQHLNQRILTQIGVHNDGRPLNFFLSYLYWKRWPYLNLSPIHSGGQNEEWPCTGASGSRTYTWIESAYSQIPSGVTSNIFPACRTALTFIPAWRKLEFAI